MQFFPSKKQKSVSPSLKSQRTEKGETAGTGGSPGAEGTLDNYLKSLQDAVLTLKGSSLDEHSPCSQESVRRKLGWHIEKVSTTENKQIASSRQEVLSDCTEAVHNDAPLRTAIDDSPSKENSSATGIENPELRSFANDFLSLYCRYHYECWIPDLFVLFMLQIKFSLAIS